jgi:hypothetical protein
VAPPKTIPADVRDTYAKLYGQRWEAIRTLRERQEIFGRHQDIKRA